MVQGIGDRLAGLIAEFGITNYILARQVGLSDASISRIIRKDQKPRPKNIKLIADFFNVHEKWFLTGKGEKYRVSSFTEERDPSAPPASVEEVIAEKVYQRLLPIISGSQADQKRLISNQNEIMRSLTLIISHMDDTEDKNDIIRKILLKIYEVLHID